MPDEKPFVQLTGTDGNVFALIGECRRAARKAGWSSEKITAFVTEVTSCTSYDAALQVMMRHFDVL